LIKAISRKILSLVDPGTRPDLCTPRHVGPHLSVRFFSQPDLNWVTLKWVVALRVLLKEGSENAAAALAESIEKDLARFATVSQFIVIAQNTRGSTTLKDSTNTFDHGLRLLAVLESLREAWEGMPMSVAALFVKIAQHDQRHDLLTITEAGEMVGMKLASTSRNIQLLENRIGERGSEPVALVEGQSTPT
jgi:hypothetical protein